MPDVAAPAAPLRGIGVGAGIVVAPLVRMGRLPDLPAASGPVEDRGAEIAAARQALGSVADLITHRLPLDDVLEGIEIVARGDAIKVTIEP